MEKCIECSFVFKQKTAYEIKECDWSSDVCSSDLAWLIGYYYNSISSLFCQEKNKGYPMTKKSNTLPNAPGHFTQVKNKMLDAFTSLDLPGNTWKVYFVIIRLTLGYHREWFTISRSDFEEKTGLCRNEITKSLQKLDQYNLIHRNRCIQKPKYMINQYVTTWKTSKKSKIDSYAPKKVYSHAPKQVHKKRDSSYSKSFKEKKERKKPFSFSDLEKTKDQIERDFFELFKDYPERTNCKKALEIFRAVVKDSGELDKIKIALEHYRKKKKKPDSIFHGLGNWMKIWKDFYDMGKLDAERKKAAEEKQRKADIEAAAERKRIKNLPAPSKDVLDKIKRKNMPGTNWSARPKKKGG